MGRPRKVPLPESAGRPLCSCGRVLTKWVNRRRGTWGYRSTCANCAPGHRKPYVRFKSDRCSHCNFIAVDACQLDVDHIDGNHDNHDPSNLRTLCANCHRLRSQYQRAARYGYGDPAKDF